MVVKNQTTHYVISFRDRDGVVRDLNATVAAGVVTGAKPLSFFTGMTTEDMFSYLKKNKMFISESHYTI